ncbi:MAG: hypothetical protein ABI462_07990 [Ignavibacteria bacterium]
MKNLFLVFVLSILLFPGCDKKENTDVIKVKHSEVNTFTDPDTSAGPTSGESIILKTISSKEVKQHVGDSLNIDGFIADIYLSDKVAYLNFENKFPKNLFTCAIFAGRMEEFGDLSKFKGKNVRVTGKITTYKNKPQVILNSKDQIKIIN